MQTIPVGEFKARFSEIIDLVKEGETVVVSYGRNRERVAALVPYAQLPQAKPRQLGVLAGKARVDFADDFAIHDEELLGA